jgi:hypothetical protein
LGATALIEAVKKKLVDLVQLLLARGSDPALRDKVRK